MLNRALATNLVTEHTGYLTRQGVTGHRSLINVSTFKFCRVLSWEGVKHENDGCPLRLASVEVAESSDSQKNEILPSKPSPNSTKINATDPLLSDPTVQAETENLPQGKSGYTCDVWEVRVALGTSMVLPPLSR